MDDLDRASDEVLLKVRDNIAAGVIRADAMLTAGTLFTKKDPKSCPPASSAPLLVMFLDRIDTMLVERGHPSLLEGGGQDATP